MTEELATYNKSQIVNVEEYAMSIDGLLRQVQLIQEVMSKVMKPDEHYGKIPGTDKPTLLKPGAEKLCLTFRLDPDYEILREVRDKDFLAYTIKCVLHHIPTRLEIASGIGSCNSKETKYRYRHKEESTGNLLPKEYWKAKSDNDSKEMKRILGEGNRAAKIDGQWVIAKSQKVENDNPWDQDNTIIKMACKRALVAATLNATAASDIFTQDLEDMEELPKQDNGKQKTGAKKEKSEPPPLDEILDDETPDETSLIDEKTGEKIRKAFANRGLDPEAFLLENVDKIAIANLTQGDLPILREKLALYDASEEVKKEGGGMA